MAALAIKGITDVDIDIGGGVELPFLDGSAAPYFRSIQPLCLSHLPPLYPHRLQSPVLAQDSARLSWAIAIPSSSLSIRALTQFPSPIGNADVQSDKISTSDLVVSRSFIRNAVDIIPLRQARDRLLGLDHAIIDEAIILWSTDRFVTKLRSDQECHYHKLLDAIGDLFCIQVPLTAEIIIFRPGHHINHLLRESLVQSLRAQI